MRRPTRPLLAPAAALALAAALAGPALAELPMPTFPECGTPDRPDLCPNDLGQQWNFLSYVPEDWKPHVREAEWAMGTGMHADLAFRRATGDFGVAIAVLDSGIYWGESNTRRKIFLNRGELPPPQRADGSTLEGAEDPYDLDGNGLLNVDDYASDARVDPASGSDPDAHGVLDAGDLIAAFSDGIDDDGNGFVDDISGWDFMWDDNDPYDDTEFGHGYWEAREAASEGNDGGYVSPCPNCSVLPIRVSDSFIADGNRFASGVLYAVDNGATVINCALGTLSNSRFVREAVDYAWERGALVVGSAADETSYHVNWPSGNPRVLYVNNVRFNDDEPETATSFLQFANSTNFGPRVDLAAPATGASSRATAIAAGIAGLVASASREGAPGEGIEPLDPPLSANELYQILITTTDDIDVEESRGENADPEMYPSQPGFDRYFGRGRINAARAVDAVLDRAIPPEADIASPEWFAYVDPDATPEVEVIGSAAARRAASFSYVVEYAVGEEPLEEAFVELSRQEGLTAPVEGRLATLRLADIPRELLDPDAAIPPITREMDNVTRADRAFLFTVTLRLRVIDDRGLQGEMRRVFFVRRDPDLLPGFPVDLGASMEASVRLADLDGDGVHEVIQPTADGEVWVLRGDGTPAQGWPFRVEPIEDVDPERKANHLAAPAYASGAVSTDVRETIMAAAAVGDVDGDGAPDVVVATLGGKVWALSASGSVLPGFPVGMDLAHVAGGTGPEDVLDVGFFASPALGDLDGDGRLDVVAAGLDGWLYAWDGTGAALPGFPVQLLYEPEGQRGQRNRITSSPAVGDLDGDGALDVVVGSNQAVGTSFAPLFAVHGDGNDHPGGPFLEGWPVLAAAVYAEALPYVGEGIPSAPALADVDGDGALEVFASAVTDPGRVLRADGTEHVALAFLADDWGSGTNSRESGGVMMVHSGSFGDLTGDGRPELVNGMLGIGWITGGAADWRREEFDHVLGAWEMDGGRMLQAWPRQVEDFQFFMNPAIADISGDGRAEAISGTGGYLLNAFDADGASPEGWPKFTGQWLAGSPAVGDVNGDGWLDVVIGSRGGWLFAWSTRGRADVPPAWGQFHHDAAGTGNHENPIEPQRGPEEAPPPAGGDEGGGGGCDCDQSGGSPAGGVRPGPSGCCSPWRRGGARDGSPAAGIARSDRGSLDPPADASIAMSRPITARYDDPLDLIWLETARRLGMRVVRSEEVYASWDGRGTLTLSAASGFDSDDSLAQLIFHEICHALVEGPAGMRRPDWGLDNTSDRDLVREHACHRLQAALAQRHGLRDFFAVTTDFRPYWDSLPEDPLAPGDDPAIPPALVGWDRARHGPWADEIDRALAATARIAEAVRPYAPEGSLWARVRPLHPVGFPLGREDRTCGACAWRARGGPGRRVDRCRQARLPGERHGPRIDPSWRACERFEPVLTEASCAACGACCREAYDLVPLGRREPLARARPDLVARDAHGTHLPRPGGRCVALLGDASAPPGYRCAVYDARPRFCREFEVGGAHCLEARRRIGLSRGGPPVRREPA